MKDEKMLFHQFEAIRITGSCNMLDINCVQWQAYLRGLYSLVSLKKQEYLWIIENYSALQDKYGE